MRRSVPSTLETSLIGDDEASDETPAAQRFGIVVCYPQVPEAQWFRDLAGIKDDIEQMKGYLGLLSEQVAENHRDFWLWEGITSAIAVAYGRCFNQGVRARVPQRAFEAAPTEILEAHQFMIELRNKHVAHSVNAYESNSLVVRLAYFRQPLHIAEVTVETMRFAPVSDGELRLITRLVEWVQVFVDAEYERERKRVFDLVASQDLNVLAEQRREPFDEWLDWSVLSKRRRS